ncbi:MAG: DUF4147 domain-containing protein [Lachnospiraceae bacterium]|nr:DUF4147 domain-containing protein [Lachnospiraceae bacterium]
MNQKLRQDANQIIEKAISAVKPEEAVKRALKDVTFSGDVYIVSVGKAAYTMAEAASKMISYKKGIVITKYDHVFGSIPNVTCYEAAHPTPDEAGVHATKEVLKMVSELKKEDTVLFLLSGGGSALFEDPLVSLEELQDVTKQLLACGADITEMNAIRKRLSKVKGGKFAKAIAPAKVYSVILSDVLGDPVDMIASGPTALDEATCEKVDQIVKKHGVKMTDGVKNALSQETPKEITNATNVVIGSVRQLCHAAEKCCLELGYEPEYLGDTYDKEARDLGEKLGSMALKKVNDRKKAIIIGGESVVHLKGNGLGGRNQEIAVGAIEKIAGHKNIAVFSVGSDGTDGPCDAAGGYVDGDTKSALESKGIEWKAMQENNDCYHILEACDGLIITGPTGTNVNDVSVVLIDES